MPVNEKDKADLLKVMQDISNSMTRSEAERDFVKEAINGLSDKYNVSKQALRSLARVYHKQNHHEVTALNTEVDELYETITS